MLYREIWDKRGLPVTESISDRILNLPIYSTLSDENVEKVCDAILRCHEFAGKKNLTKAHRA
jgi:dTDP-4-amino-4,6-dideoxygalactose transaminase